MEFWVASYNSSLFSTKKMGIWNILSQRQKQPFRGVVRKRCSENLQRIYRRTPMPKKDFNKVVKQLYWNCTLEWIFSCNTVNLLHVFRRPFSKNTYRDDWFCPLPVSKFIEITLRHGCSPVNLLHVFRTPFSKNTSGRLLLERICNVKLQSLKIN